MFGLGFSEILFLGVMALVIIGPDDLPKLARTLGRFLNDIRRSTNGVTDEFRSQIKIDLEDSAKSHRQKSRPDILNPSEKNENE